MEHKKKGGKGKGKGGGSSKPAPQEKKGKGGGSSKPAPKIDQKEQQHKPALPEIYRPKYNQAVYVLVSKYKNEHYTPFTRVDFIVFMEKILKVGYWLELMAEEKRGFYIIQILKSDHDGVLESDPRVVDNVFHHQVTLTTKLPLNWATHNFLLDVKRNPKPEKRVLNAQVGKNCLSPPTETDLFARMLPVEMHIRVLQYCSARDICNMSRCSKYWHDVGESDSIWKGLCLLLLPEEYDETEEEKMLLDHQKKMIEDERKARLEAGSYHYDPTEEAKWDALLAEEETIEQLTRPSKSDASVTWKQEYAARLAKCKIKKQRVLHLHEARMSHRYWMMCGVHMFHPVNGRSGFDALPPPEFPPGVEKPSLETIKAMLKREDELRLSPTVQARFSDPAFDAILIAADVQEQVAKEFGFGGSKETLQLGVECIRAAPALYPDNPEIRRIPHYRRYNRSRKGELEAGHTVPNAYLAQLSGAPVHLFKYLDTLTSDKPVSTPLPPPPPQPQQRIPRTVVIACGSYT